MEYSGHGLSVAQVSRYSRQLLVPEFGPNGQAAVSRSRALIVGGGGLGCPVAQYLAAAGVGVLGVVDADVVDTSNLHRQVLHHEHNVGLNKALSIQTAVNKLNSNVRCVAHQTQFTTANAMDMVEDYDIIIDCSDNAPTRYLCNDVAVLSNKVLVSGSALRWDGQCTVYNHRPVTTCSYFEYSFIKSNGPCYRCIFPQPPPMNTVTNCAEGGVIGPIVGIIGSVQALEALKLLAGIQPSYAGRMFVFNGLEGCTKTITLRQRRVDCAVCGDTPSIHTPVDYALFCGMCNNDKGSESSIIADSDRLSVLDLPLALEHCQTLIDTRPTHEFAIGALPHSINVPLEEMNELEGDALRQRLQLTAPLADKPVIVVCRRGNDSQLAVQLLKAKLQLDNVKDVIGGLTDYATHVDTNFPIY